MNTKSLIKDFLRAAENSLNAETQRLDGIKDMVPTKVFYGSNPLTALPDLLTEYGIGADAPALIVTGQGSVKKQGYYDKVVRHLGSRPVIDISGVTPDAVI